MIDLKYVVKENWLPTHLADNLVNNYPIDYIKEWCANPESSDHESSLHGNYSAPAEEFDPELYAYIESKLDEIAIEHLGENKSRDQFYISFHYDTKRAWLEPHNDLKDFRWRITNQVYLNDNQGARPLDRKLNVLGEFPCKSKVYYSILATPWSWHDVPEISSEKKSIVFRIGKFTFKSIAHPNLDNKTAYVIFNNFHRDPHYAKLGLRMGNLTEAWLYNLGAENIYHTRWRNEDSMRKIVGKALQTHDTVHVVASGWLPDNLDNIESCPAVQTVTRDNPEVDVNAFGDCEHYYRLTDDNIPEYADIVFGGYIASDHRLAKAEILMSDYYARDLHLNYADMF